MSTKISILICLLINTIYCSAQLTDSITDSRDSKIYKTITIGTQTWMAENLAFKTHKGCWAYDNVEINAKANGYLYNWETARNVCPSGWHLPSDKEWTILTDYLGGLELAGTKMKSTSFWDDDGNGTNESGFNGYPCGTRNGGSATYDYHGVYGSWWTSTPSNTSNAWFRFLFNGDGRAYRNYSDRSNGVPVRCIKN